MSDKPYLPLANEWAAVLLSQPETGMSYQVVTITLKDGTKYPQVVIVGGNVTRVRGHSSIPFSADDIAAIEVTHDKWNW